MTPLVSFLLFIGLLICSKAAFVARYHFNGTEVGAPYSEDDIIDDLSGNGNILSPIGDDVRVAEDRDMMPTAIGVGIADYLYSQDEITISAATTYTVSAVYKCREACTIAVVADAFGTTFWAIKIEAEGVITADIVRAGSLAIDVASRTTSALDGEWHVVGVIRKQDSIQIFFDDRLVGEGTLPMQSDFNGRLSLGGTGEIIFDIFSIQDGDASAIEDPHLETFDGRKFDFMGAPGKYYALYTDKYAQVNCLLAPWEIYGPEATVISEIGIMTENAKLSAHRAGEFMMNGKFLEKGVTIDFEDGTLETTENKMKISTEAIYAEIEVAKDDFGSYLNIAIRLGTKVHNPHGLLGQSSENRSEDDPFEGSADDYLVEELFNHQFRFSRFNRND